MQTASAVPHNPAEERLALDSSAAGGAGAFSGLLLRGAGKPATAVILLHGRVGGPDGPVVGWLRKALNAAGYSTLSLENPVPSSGGEFTDYAADVSGPNKLFPEAGARIQAAMAEMKRRGCEAAVLGGFSMGARMTSAFLASGTSGALPVKGFIATGIGVNGPGPLDATSTLGKVKVPVIDVCGAADGEVAKTADKRAGIYKAGGGRDYATHVLAGEIGHNLAGAEPEAQKQVLAWLAKHAPLA
jgi:predicted alpha/beta-hydrolase family hydrolase